MSSAVLGYGMNEAYPAADGSVTTVPSEETQRFPG